MQHLSYFVLSFSVIFGCQGQRSFYSDTLENSYDALRRFRSRNLSQPQNIVEIKKALRSIHEVNRALENGQFADTIHRETLTSYYKTELNDFDGSNCTADIQLMIEAIRRPEPWALQMIDAYGKPESDILGLNFRWLGSYDECMGVEPIGYRGIPGDRTNKTHAYVPFKPQYCTTTLTSKSPIKLPDIGHTHLSFSIGMCFPNSCSNVDVKSFLHAIINSLPDANRTQLKVVNVECPRQPEIDRVAILAIAILGFLTFLSLVGTTMDLFCTFIKENKVSIKTKPSPTEITSLVDSGREESTTEPGILRKILVSFSLYTNGKKLLNTMQSSESLTALNGVRFLSISWVVLGHSYAFSLNDTKNAVYVREDMMTRWTFQAITNALVSVDSFFALSGLLLAYLTLKEINRRGGIRNFNWAMFYFHRFWRLTPVYMLLMLADIGLYRYLGDGPLWPEDGVEKDQCKDSWWWNLLYINNFEVKKGVKACFGHAWYLANDMQFFVLSPLMIIPLYIHGIFGMCVCMAFLLGSWIATGLISTHYDLPPIALSSGNKYGTYYYEKPWCRIGPYIVGIIAGFILYKFKGRIRINKFTNLLIWAIVGTLAIVILYGLHGYFNGDHFDTKISSLYNTTHRTLWGVVVCWVIVACATGHGGFVNTLLSWRAFAPLARLSYCVYLANVFVMYSYYQSQRQLFYLRDYEGIFLFLGHLVLSNMVAFVASLLFEAPMLGLEKVIFRREAHSR